MNSELSKTRLNRYALLRHKKYREKEGLFMVQGEKSVKDTLNNFEVDAILTLKDKYFDWLEVPDKVYKVSEADLRRISTLEKSPDIVAIYRIPYSKHSLHLVTAETCLVLDGVQDPGNLGTIVRTAHWFGLRKIYCSKDTVDLYNPKVVLASMGSIGKLDVVYCDLNDLFSINPTVPVYGLSLTGEDIFSFDSYIPGFILMGSEGHGISDVAKTFITKSLTIPPSEVNDHPESLNVATAVAITISQLLK